MTSVIATLSLAALLAQAPAGSSFNPTRRAPPSAPAAESPAPAPDPSLFAAPQPRGAALAPRIQAHTPIIGEVAPRGAAGPTICHARAIAADASVDRGIAVPVPTDRDYKIKSITPDCLE